MHVHILSKLQFEDVLKRIDEIKDCFFVSILDPDDKIPLKESCENYKTFYFYDLEQDIQTYKAFSYEQAEELYSFIEANKDKKRCVIHCTAGVSRSGAVGEFIHELYGGSYKELVEKFPNISPSGRVLMYLRYAEKANKQKDNNELQFTV